MVCAVPARIRKATGKPPDPRPVAASRYRTGTNTTASMATSSPSSMRIRAVLSGCGWLLERYPTEPVPPRTVKLASCSISASMSASRCSSWSRDDCSRSSRTLAGAEAAPDRGSMPASSRGRMRALVLLRVMPVGLSLAYAACCPMRMSKDSRLRFYRHHSVTTPVLPDRRSAACA